MLSRLPQPCGEIGAPYITVCKTPYDSLQPADRLAVERVVAVQDILSTSVGSEHQIMDRRLGVAAARRPASAMLVNENQATPLAHSYDISIASAAQRVQLVRTFGCGHGGWRVEAGAAIAVLPRFFQVPSG